MDAQSWNIAVEDDAEEEGLRGERWGGHDYLIFLIDCSEAMCKTKLEDGSGTIFDACVKVVTAMYRRRCVTNDKDFLAVLLFNTVKSKNSHSFENISVFHELSLPDAGQVKQLEELLTKEGKKKFEQEYGHGEAKMDETFWMAGTMFSAQGMKEGTKRVFLLTNNDKPHKNEADLRKRVIQKIQDLRDQDIGVEIIAVGNPDFNFDFYAKPLDMSAEEAAQRASQTLDELMKTTVAKGYKRRSMANLMFQIGSGIELAVGLYNMYSIARIPTATTVDRKTNEPVASARTFMDTETGEKILQVDLKKYQVYGGKKIALEKDEVDQLKTNVAKEADDAAHGSTAAATGLVLLGFKPQSYLKPSHFIQPGIFAYPEEKYVGGSAKLFRALLEKCAERRVMAVCRLVARTNMAPRLVALLPQLEERDKDTGQQQTPPGFNIVYLPYADDIRDLQKVTEQRTRGHASVDQIQKAKALVKKLSIASYDPANVQNPVLQKHYRAVEAIALERESVEEVEDQTLPNLEWMEKKAKKEMEEFSSAVFSENYSAGGKRKKAAAGADAAAKKAKTEDIDLEAEARAHRLEKITVPVLRQLCNQLNIQLHGTRKADLIQQINKHFGV